jgi:ribosomal protein L11 methyltransferase
MFDASSVDAVDIDPAAVEAAARNAAANGVDIRCGSPEHCTGKYQTVLANILATPLKVLAPLLCARLEPGGQLVLAGILERQEHELLQAYAPYARLSVAASKEGWILMTARL